MTFAGRLMVGICAYNEENNIGRLLENLTTKQALPRDAKIVVVCSGCTDKTPQIVKEFAAKDSRIKLVTEKRRRGKAHALNKLFETAKKSSEILILTNADAIPAEGSIEKLVTKLSESKAGAAFAQPTPFTGSSGLSDKIVRAIWRLHHIVSAYKTPKLSGELCAIHTDCLQRIPENVATDEPYIELAIRRQGYRVVYVPEARVYIRGPNNPVDLMKQRKRIWIGHMQIESTTGFKVSTANFLGIFKTLSLLKPHEVLYIFFGGFLELIAYLEAKSAFRRHSIPYAWEPIKSTKTQV